MPDRMGWIRWLPGLITLREYQASWLMHDIAAGVVLATMLVPVGIAYAVASGVPGIYGLYATIVPLLAYALFGPSRILVLGAASSRTPLALPATACSAPLAPPARTGWRRVTLHRTALEPLDRSSPQTGLPVHTD